MKKHLFLLLTICASCNLFAQYDNYLTPDGPPHALKPIYVRLNVDTVYGICHVPSPWSLQVAQMYEELGIPFIGLEVLKHSEDGLTDTIFSYSPENSLTRVDVKRYDENQRIMWETTWNYLSYLTSAFMSEGSEPQNHWYTIREFEYDTKNRISKITYKDIYYLLDEVHIDVTETFDYSTIVMTEKGYIYNGFEYEIDELNRVTYIKNLTLPDNFFENGEYVELDGKQYRVEDMYFTYYEGGISALQYQKTGYWASDIKVHGISGAIILTASSNSVVSIYNSNGTMLKKQYVNAGVTQIPVSVKGLYFVTTNNNSFKVAVY